MAPISEQDEFLLSQLLDGDLPESEASPLRARISREPALRSALDELERLNAALVVRRTSRPEIDFAALRADIMGEIEVASRPSIIRFPAWRWTAGLVAAAAAIALIVVVYRPMNGRPLPDQFAMNSSPHIEHATSPDKAPANPTLATPENAVSVADTTPTKSTDPVAHEPAGRPLVVKFNRPDFDPGTAQAVKVSYSRSDQLANEMQKRDEERRSRPVIRMVVAQRTRSKTAAAGAGPFDSPL